VPRLSPAVFGSGIGYAPGWLHAIDYEPSAGRSLPPRHSVCHMSRSASSERPWGQGRLHPSAADQLQDFIVPLESDGEPHFLVSLSHLFRSVFIAQLLALSLFDKKKQQKCRFCVKFW